MPVVSYLSISMRPPVVGVACFPSGFTLGLAQKAGAFSLSALDERYLRKVSKLAETSGHWTRNKVKAAGFKPYKGAVLGTPQFKEASASLECRIISTAEIGDHVLLTGEVVAARSSDAFSDYWDFGRYRPILYAGWRKGMTAYRPPPQR